MVERRLSGLELLHRRVRRRRRVERMAALVGVAVLLALTLFGYLGLRRSVDGEPVSIKTVAELSRLTGLTFPAAAVLTEGVRRRGWHHKILAVVAMPHAAATGFLAQPHLDEVAGVTAVTEQEKRSLADPRNVQGDLSSWDVGSVRDFRIARWEIRGLPKPYTAGVGSVLVGLDDPRHVRVYLCYWAD